MGRGNRFDRIEDLGTYLSSLPKNTPDAPYTVKLDITDIDGLTDILQAAARYVSLDLSGSGLDRIGREAFVMCKNLVSVTLPGGVATIGRDAFNGCASLAGIILPISVWGIGQRAFAGCTSLTSVTFLSAIASGGFAHSAFKGLGGLRDKYFSKDGGAGTYTTAVPVNKSSAWTKQP